MTMESFFFILEVTSGIRKSELLMRTAELIGVAIEISFEKVVLCI